MQTPTIGRIVIYNTTPEEQTAMQEKHGNKQEQLPAIITAVWSETTVNLRVIADGPGACDIWKTSAPLGITAGCWQWPEIKR